MHAYERGIRLEVDRLAIQMTMKLASVTKEIGSKINAQVIRNVKALYHTVVVPCDSHASRCLIGLGLKLFELPSTQTDTHDFAAQPFLE